MYRVKKEHIGTVLTSGRGSTVLKEDTDQELLKKLADNPKRAYLVERIEDIKTKMTKDESGKSKRETERAAADTGGVPGQETGQ